MSDASKAAIQNIYTRTSVRTYAPDHAISPDTVEILLRAAMAAPSAVNKQPWEFVVINTRDLLDTLANHLPYAQMLRHAPLAVVTCADMDRVVEGETPDRGFWIQDLSAATQNLLLAAHALGLGAVWTGVYPDMERAQAVQQTLGLPATVVPLAVVPVGYPEGEHNPKDKWDTSKVHYNGWQ